MKDTSHMVRDLGGILHGAKKYDFQSAMSLLEGPHLMRDIGEKFFI